MRSVIIPVFILALLGCMVAEPASAGAIWSIGRNDGDYGELAIPGAYGDFLKAFPDGVCFSIGADKARDKWPFIHPGPTDAWAGEKNHTFQVTFSMKNAPKDACRLMVYYCDTHSNGAPVLSIKINEHVCGDIQLPRGAGDASLTNAKAGKPGAQPVVFPGNWLQRGENVIALTLTGGSWLLYDAITLESGIPNVPKIERLAAICTPMFKRVDGTLKQAVRVEVLNAGLEGKGTLELAGAGGVEQSVDLVQGQQAHYLLVTPFTESSTRSVSLTVGDKTEQASFEAKPEKQWKLYVGASAHTDIGYTDLQEKCMALHVDNTATALDAIQKDPDFRWNLEVFAHADWIKELRPDIVPELEKQIKERKIGLTALYLNMLTGLCSGEEMMWLLRPAQMYGRLLGVPVDMASLNDVPSTMGTLPMFFRHAGIRYFSDAINEDRGPSFMHAEPEMIQSPFWWEAPDQSRILAIFTRTYFQVTQINMHVSPKAMEETLPRFMGKFVRPDYPCDAIYINGAFLDNCAMSPRYAEVAAEWNKTWDFPKVILATTDEYFRYVEEHFANALPVYRGDMGGYWEDGAASSALETEMVRWAKNSVTPAEKWQALAMAHGGEKSSLDAYTAMWKDILYYDEHTWGSAVSISDPNNPQTSGQWARKAAFATRSQKQARDYDQYAADALRHLAKAGKNDASRTWLVANPLSWERDIVVTLPADVKASGVRDKAAGKAVPAQMAADGKLVFIAQHVPAMGYRLYEIVQGRAAKSAGLLKGISEPYSWASDRWQFEIDPKTGGLRSLRDLKTGREWVDAASGFSMNQFLCVMGGNGTSMIHPGMKLATDLAPSSNDAASVGLVENGPARAVLHITRTGGVYPVDTDLVIHADGTIDFINVVHKTETLEREGGYFVFPFGLNTPDSARAFLEVPYGIIEADTEQMPGACREWYSVNTFAAAANAAGTAYLASPDTPLFTVGDINRGRWPSHLQGNRHVLYAYVFNNYWHTNYKASQGGEIRCAFSIKLEDTPFDPMTATQFGWARSLDLTPERPSAIPAYGAGTAKQSFVDLDGPVVLGELLPVEGGLLARLYNPAPVAAMAELEIPGVAIKEMLSTDLFGENGTVLKCDSIPVPARGIATVRMQLR